MATPIYTGLAGQRVRFTATLSGEPATGIPSSFEVIYSQDAGGIELSDAVGKVIEVYDTPGAYEVEVEPFEFEPLGTTFLVNVTSSVAGVTIVADTYTVTDPTTTVAGDKYCTLAQLYAKYGNANVTKWADLNGFGRPIDLATRIMDEIVTQTSRINTVLRRKRYTLPFDTVPTEVMDVCRGFTAYHLATARGVEDEDDRIKVAYHDAQQLLQGIVDGSITLDAETHKVQPQLYDKDEGKLYDQNYSQDETWPFYRWY